eukprot:12202806-Ditylum_brightwellii.AAC.1
MVKENIISSPYVVDIHCTTMADEKGIWTIETTKEKLQKAMGEVDDGLDTLQNVIPDIHFIRLQHFQSHALFPIIAFPLRIQRRLQVRLKGYQAEQSKHILVHHLEHGDVVLPLRSEIK